MEFVLIAVAVAGLIFLPKVFKFTPPESAKHAAIRESAENLAETVVAAAQMLPASGSKYLGRSSLTMADSAVFVCFLLRMSCISSARTRENIDIFDETFSPAVIRQIEGRIGYSDVKKIFDDRTAFYDSLVLQNKGRKFQEVAAKLQETFKRVIQQDIDLGRYELFYEHSPVLLVGIEADMDCLSEITAFLQVVLHSARSFEGKVEAALRS